VDELMADATATGQTGTAPAVVVEPRFKRVMPWTLIVLGVALAGYAAFVQQRTTEASRVTVESGMTAQSVTTTRTGPSDTFIDLLFGTAAVVALAGAFYGRITKIAFPGGGGLEMGAVALDMDKIAKTVAEQVKREVEKKPEAERPDVEQVARLAAQATARAQQSALQVRAAVGPLVTPAPVTVEAKELQQAQRGMPLPDELVQRLAANAVRDVLDGR
jgi:hypothetical protein